VAHAIVPLCRKTGAAITIGYLSQQVFELYCNGVTMHKAGLDSITIQIEICIEIIEIRIEIIISNCDECYDP
jgi:Iap family predicted aminopeptidase